MQPQPKRHLRKVITILILSVIFFSELGYYFFYTLQQCQLKQQMNKEWLAAIPLASLQKIELDKNIHLIEWEEEGKEFYLDEQLYDVQKIVIENGKTILYCLNDKKEEQLLKDMANATEHNNNKQKNNLSLKIFPDYCLTELAEKISIPTADHHQSFFYFNETALSTVKEITVPPPRP